MPASRERTGPLGVVYTPPALARAMVEGLLGPLVQGRTAKEILAVRVCDPAMGDGAFLVEVVRYLAEQTVAASEREGTNPLHSAPTSMAAAIEYIARHNVIGADIDETSVNRVAVRLDEMCGTTLGTRFYWGLKTADALTLDWLSSFASVDAVIANPPYIRQESLASEAIQKEDLRRWMTFDGVADLYVYFIELAHGLLKKGGRYAVLVPNKWMTAEYARPLRAFLARQQSVDAIVDLSAMKVFDDADAFPCVLFGTTGGEGAREMKAIKTNATDSFAAVVDANAHVTRVEHGNSDVDDGHLIDYDAADERPAAMGAAATGTNRPEIISVDRSRLADGPWHIDSIEDAALLARLTCECRPLGEIIGTRWSRGVVTGCNDAFVIDEKTRDALLAADPTKTSELIRPFVKGRDVRAFSVRDPSRWILLVDRGTPVDALPPAVRAHLEKFRERLEPRPPTTSAQGWTGRKPGAYAWHELQDPVVPLAKSRAPRMLYQDIQTTPLCALDLEGEVVPDTTVWILPSNDLVLLAILNSPVYRWIAQRRFPPALNGAVRPKLQYMQQLPIPAVTGALRGDITSCVEQRIRHVVEGENWKGIDLELVKLISDAYKLTRAERELVRA